MSVNEATSTVWPRRVVLDGRLPWSAVREAMWSLRHGTVPIRYVACVCPWCGWRNRVIVHVGGSAMSPELARRKYGSRMANSLFNPGSREDPVWTAGEIGRGAARLAQCGSCGAKWSVSMHANGPAELSGVSVPLEDCGHQQHEKVFS